jgi:hypothetical protein
MKFLHTLAMILISLNTQAALPEWVNNIGPCSESEICVIGSGNNLKSALADGSSNLAKYFEEKVKVDLSISHSSKEDNSKLNSSTFDEWTSKSINIESDEILSGIEQKKSGEFDGNYYVLLSLSKDFAAKNLKDKIEKLDKENEILFSHKTRFNYPLIFKNLKKRQYFYDRFKVVSSGAIKSLVSEDQMLGEIQKLNSVKVLLKSTNEKLPPSLLNLLEQIFSPLKVIFVSSKEGSDYTLRTRFKYNEEYFKVEGFKKLTLYLKLELLDKKNKMVGRVSSTHTIVARSKESALNLSLESLEEQIRTNLNQLVNDIKTGDVK